MKKESQKIKVQTKPASLLPDVIQKVESIANKKQWSFSKTAGYFIQRGLDADKEFQKAA